MICPKCRAEYVVGVTVCFDCGVDLVDRLEQAEPADARAGGDARGRGGGKARPASDEHSAPVAVYATADPGLMAIAQTMLESAGIPVIVEGAANHGFYGAGPLGGLHLAGPAVLRVAPSDVDDARAALADLLADTEGPGAPQS